MTLVQMWQESNSGTRINGSTVAAVMATALIYSDTIETGLWYMVFVTVIGRLAFHYRLVSPNKNTKIGSDPRLPLSPHPITS